MDADKLIIVGAITGAFGTQGEVRLKSFCAKPQDIGTYGTLFSEDGTKVFEITITRPVKNGFAARVKGVRFKDQADALRGIALHVPRNELPNLPDDEFYHSDLIGLQVLDTGGVKLGKIKAVLDHGAGDILEISTPGLKQPALLPFTKSAVPTVDLASGRVIVDPPFGIFSDE
ncbi:MAG: ribosome maturation factor RimM [Pseudomonadota bacterium]